MKNVEKETALLTGYSDILGVVIGSIVFGYIKNYGKMIDLIIGIAFIIIVYIRMLGKEFFLKSKVFREKRCSVIPYQKPFWVR